MTAILDELEKAAIAAYPAWLPGAEHVTGPGGAGVGAVRALALRSASATRHFGPFLADLAETALTGRRPGRRFDPSVRAAGLARVLADAFGHAAVLLRIPEGLAPDEAESLAAACDWLAGHGGLTVLSAEDGSPYAERPRGMTAWPRTESVAPAGNVPTGPESKHSAEGGVRSPGHPPVGRPHPVSAVEQALEAALASCAWAHGREWNQTYRSGPLVNPIRVDLLWREERCAVEIDGPDHDRSRKYADDRDRDLRLERDGYSVLRITNTQVSIDIDGVLSQIERLVRGRRRNH
ncbi:DUF559 domain-containing protein [Sphaerisporangium sp. TRM90804]|uniref:endonuclease domain-containing protein n=1 Tax=Sphaerisporangium sp. TRM90804 TaxID=3031113 RepID=UPI00244B9037|nr:DUF559 domain-containing protein [Sphaerisporangium sp. TRM90804]MDH2427257.1 DUF559 domain-containing protein [Sphaerisporangium sp. TRM90804]